MLEIEKSPAVPNKSFFKLDEVCTITAVKPYVLRYWENEFQEISPVASSSGQKLYSQKDIETILEVKKLMFEQKLTIERAKLEIKAVGHNKTLGQSEVVVNQEMIATSPLPISPSTMSDSQKQKLILAKAKLVSLIANCEDFKRSQNWC
jgi:DNA-binding transcriptional MerR regulator